MLWVVRTWMSRLKVGCQRPRDDPRTREPRRTCEQRTIASQNLPLPRNASDESLPRRRLLDYDSSCSVAFNPCEPRSSLLPRMDGYQPTRASGPAPLPHSRLLPSIPRLVWIRSGLTTRVHGLAAIWAAPPASQQLEAHGPPWSIQLTPPRQLRSSWRPSTTWGAPCDVRSQQPPQTMILTTDEDRGLTRQGQTRHQQQPQPPCHRKRHR